MTLGLVRFTAAAVLLAGWFALTRRWERVTPDVELALAGGLALDARLADRAARYRRRGATDDPQPDRFQLHQHQSANQLFRQTGVFTQRKSNILEHAEIGEQCTALKQHPHPLPQLSPQLLPSPQLPSPHPV